MNTKQNINENVDLQQQGIIQEPRHLKYKFFGEIKNKNSMLKKAIQHKKKSCKIKKQTSEKNNQKLDEIDFTEAYSQQENLQQKKTVSINGNKITGTWKNNLLDGHVIIQYRTGDYFQGLYSHGQKIEGKLIFNDGTCYQGQFKNDLFHGQGKITDTNRRVIKCQWVQGKHTQKVTIEYPNGDIYYGEVKKMKKHGEGHLFLKNGNKYIGKFNEGAITGYGAYYENDKLVAEGLWVNGTLQIENRIKQILQIAFKTVQKIEPDSYDHQISGFHSIHSKSNSASSNHRKGMIECINIV